jgi:hypothetical protein
VAAIQVLHHFHGLRPERAGSALPLPHANAGTLTTPQASLDAADRSVASPKGLSTLGFDPDRFQSEPPACYRASCNYPDRTCTGWRRRASDQVSFSISTS